MARRVSRLNIEGAAPASAMTQHSPARRAHPRCQQIKCRGLFDSAPVRTSLWTPRVLGPDCARDMARGWDAKSLRVFGICRICEAILISGFSLFFITVLRK